MMAIDWAGVDGKSLTSVGVLQGADVVELDNVTALAAALDGAVTGDLYCGLIRDHAIIGGKQHGRNRLTVNQLTW